MKVIYEDSKILVIYKKAGQLTQSGKNFDVDLTSEVLNYRKKKGEDVYAALINRLDRQVSGLVLFAKTKAEAGRLSKQMQQGGFNKQYYGWICGKPKDNKGSLVDFLKKDEKSNTSMVVTEDESGAKRAELEYEVIKTVEVASDGESTETQYLSLVRIHLITGRHHQIRVQFASRGCPLLGDGKYGEAGAVSVQDARNLCNIRVGRQEIALCAYSLEVDGNVYTVLPEWFSEN
ncbi:MAG: RNA pseudouridine synthase [Lachnospira sp.]|nr:RNA pseudouridine synthase [Lachnospira sp.]